MSEVVQFPAKSEDIWVCQCGCGTFELLAVGTARCAACETPAGAEQGGWNPPKNAPEWIGDPPIMDLHGNGSESFARVRMAQIVKDQDVSVIVIARDNGTVHAWSSAETPEQLAWVKERLAAASDLLLRQSDE
jgi:hypothetical protein